MTTPNGLHRPTPAAPSAPALAPPLLQLREAPPPGLSLPPELHEYHRLKFEGETYQENLRIFEQEPFCPKITDHVFDLPVLRRVSTHPAVLFNLRSPALIRAKLRDDVCALAPSERTPEGFSKCVNNLMKPIQEGYCRARGLYLFAPTIMLKAAGTELAKAYEAAKLTVLRKHSNPEQLMRELENMKDEVSNKVLRLLARCSVFDPAPEFLQLVARDAPALRAAVAKVFGVQAYESMRASIRSLPSASLPELMRLADSEMLCSLTDACTIAGYASIPCIQLLNEQFHIFSANPECAVQPPLALKMIDDFTDALRTLRGVKQLLDTMRLLPDTSTDSLLGMLDHLAPHLLPTASTCGSSAVQTMVNINIKALECKVAGLQATAKHVQAVDFMAKQALQAASAAEERQAEDRQRLRNTQSTAHRANVAAEEAKKAASRAEDQVAVLSQAMETLKRKFDEELTSQKRQRTDLQASPVRVEELEGRRLSFPAADTVPAGQTGVAPAPGAAPQLRGRNGLALAAAAAAASAECYVANEAAAVAGIDGQQPGFHPGCGGAAQPQILQARARVRELARRPAQLQRAVRHEAARLKRADDARGREQEAAWPQEPQAQLGMVFEGATGLQLNHEALGQLQWQQGLLAEQPDFGREVALPTFAVGHGPPALVPAPLQQEQQLQQGDDFNFPLAAFRAAPAIGLPRLPPAPGEQHAPTAEAPPLADLGLLAAEQVPGADPLAAAGQPAPLIGFLPLPAGLYAAALPDAVAASALPGSVPAADPGGLARQMAGLGLHRGIPAGLSQELGAAMAGALNQ